jgi:hypothetical protein
VKWRIQAGGQSWPLRKRIIANQGMSRPKKQAEPLYLMHKMQKSDALRLISSFPPRKRDPMATGAIA